MKHILHLNPESMHKNPAYSQAVVASGTTKTIYVGGQDGVDNKGVIVSKELGPQTEQALKNILEILAAAGAGPEDVVRVVVYLVQGQDVNEGLAAWQKVWGPHPTAVTVVMVAGLGVPGSLVEIEATAAIKE